MILSPYTIFVIAFTRYTRFVFVSGEMFCSSAHLFILVKGIIFFAIFVYFLCNFQFRALPCNFRFRFAILSFAILSVLIIFSWPLFSILAFFLAFLSLQGSWSALGLRCCGYFHLCNFICALLFNFALSFCKFRFAILYLPSYNSTAIDLIRLPLVFFVYLLLHLVTFSLPCNFIVYVNSRPSTQPNFIVRFYRRSSFSWMMGYVYI